MFDTLIKEPNQQNVIETPTKDVFSHCVSLPILWFHPTSDAMDKSEAEPNVSAQLAWINSWAKTYKWTVSKMWHHTYKLVIYLHIYIYYKNILHKHHHTLYIYVALSIYIYTHIIHNVCKQDIDIVAQTNWSHTEAPQRKKSTPIWLRKIRNNLPSCMMNTCFQELYAR